jgi:hypothetical protein
MIRSVTAILMGKTFAIERGKPKESACSALPTNAALKRFSPKWQMGRRHYVYDLLNSIGRKPMSLVHLSVRVQNSLG